MKISGLHTSLDTTWTADYYHVVDFRTITSSFSNKRRVENISKKYIILIKWRIWSNLELKKKKNERKNKIKYA